MRAAAAPVNELSAASRFLESASWCPAGRPWRVGRRQQHGSWAASASQSLSTTTPAPHVTGAPQPEPKRVTLCWIYRGLCATTPERLRGPGPRCTHRPHPSHGPPQSRPGRDRNDSDGPSVLPWRQQWSIGAVPAGPGGADPGVLLRCTGQVQRGGDGQPGGPSAGSVSAFPSTRGSCATTPEPKRVIPEGAGRCQGGLACRFAVVRGLQGMAGWPHGCFALIGAGFVRGRGGGSGTGPRPGRVAAPQASLTRGPAPPIMAGPGQAAAG
jgi:hypothetical protein